MTRCMCIWPADCNGTGAINCIGCGGDLCICGACHGHGQTECPGCDECLGWDEFLMETDEFVDDYDQEPTP